MMEEKMKRKCSCARCMVAHTEHDEIFIVHLVVRIIQMTKTPILAFESVWPHHSHYMTRVAHAPYPLENPGIKIYPSTLSCGSLRTRQWKTDQCHGHGV